MVRNRSQLLNGHEMEVKKIIVVRQTTKAVASKLSLKKKTTTKEQSNYSDAVKLLDHRFDSCSSLDFLMLALACNYLKGLCHAKLCNFITTKMRKK